MQSGTTKLDIQTVAHFDDHGCTVWRICWNVTGTILASSADDGCVRMFKSKYTQAFQPNFKNTSIVLPFCLLIVNYINLWKPVAVLKGDGSQVPNENQRSSALGFSNMSNLPASQTARYIKLGSISQPRDVPWH